MTNIPFPDHPRPDFQRTAWINLNGPWRFAFDPQAIGEQERWHRPGFGQPKDLTITVPYPWESRLSGLAAPTYKGAAWYEREITIPDDWEGLDPYLHFGAIDWSARVWLDGQLIGEHNNGYLPFSCNLADYLSPGQIGTVTVRAYDIADAATLVGKQVPRWYTHSSGIWQSVWLEGRPRNHVSGVRVVPEIDATQAQIELTISITQPGAFTLRLTSPDNAWPVVEQPLKLETGAHSVTLPLKLTELQLWSPESPYLYRLAIELSSTDSSPADQVQSYFGMRSVSRACWEDNNYEYILLNGEPVYLRGALDQAFHPDGVHSYPSDETIRGDIQLAKDLGLNMLRCHIKINDPRYYYWADRLGVLMMYDWPSPDIDTPSMRDTWEATLKVAIQRDFNHPSIFAWVLFNETWGLENQLKPEGQAWLKDMVQLTKRLDPTRLVEDNSPCNYDHVTTDINSWHYYLNDYAQVKQHIQRVVDETYPGSSFNYVGGEYVQDRQPLMNSEYAGISARMGDRDISWTFKYHTNELRRHAKICGYVYTELTDIEWEHNGFVNYDRSRKYFGYDFFVPDMTVSDLNAADFVGFDAPPCQNLTPGTEFTAAIFISHFGEPMGQAQVRWQLTCTDRFGRHDAGQEGLITVRPERYEVTTLDHLKLTMPQEAGLVTLALWLEDESGRIRCRNYINIELREARSARLEQTPSGLALRFEPGAFARTSWPRPAVHPDGAKFAASGSGWVEYDLKLPADFDLSHIERVRLRFEAGAQAGRAKIDWPQRIQGTNYPQTEETQYPTDLTILTNDLAVGTLRLADDPADARGSLSHYYDYDPGSYGYLNELILPEPELESLRSRLAADRVLCLRFEIAANAEFCGGLSLYGETLGCYPLDPMVILEFRAGS